MRLVEIVAKQPDRIERRRDVRTGARLVAEIVDRESGKLIRGVTANVSVGGCFVEARDSFAPGTTVQLALAGWERRFQCKARVVHLCAGIGMGLNFPRFNALGWLTKSPRGSSTPREHWLATE